MHYAAIQGGVATQLISLRSVVKGCLCFNLVLIQNYDTNSSLGLLRGDPALLTTPLTSKPDMYIRYIYIYLLSIL